MTKPAGNDRRFRHSDSDEGRLKVKTLDRWKVIASAVFPSADIYAGTTAGLLVGCVSEFGTHVQDQGILVLVTYALLGAALLAVVLGALAILVTFFDDHFRQVVAHTEGGVGAAMLPYKVVAFVGGTGATIAMIGAIVWPSLPHYARASLLGVVTLLIVWAVYGTYQLVGLTVFFGAERSKLMEGITSARAMLEQRRRSA